MIVVQTMVSKVTENHNNLVLAQLPAKIKTKRFDIDVFFIKKNSNITRLYRVLNRIRKKGEDTVKVMLKLNYLQPKHKISKYSKSKIAAIFFPANIELNLTNI